MTNEATLRELIAWWRGVAKDEEEISDRMRTHSPYTARDAGTRAIVRMRCADQLELALAGKPFNPDL